MRVFEGETIRLCVTRPGAKATCSAHRERWTTSAGEIVLEEARQHPKGTKISVQRGSRIARYEVLYNVGSGMHRELSVKSLKKRKR